MTTVGFVGLGSMGNPMARRLLEAGHTLRVCDTNHDAVNTLEQAGAVAAGSVTALAAESDIIFASLPTPPVVLAVAGEIARAPRRTVQTFVDLSTTGPTASRGAAAELAGAGIAFVDAPVSGGRASIPRGTLSIMVSASQDAFAHARPLLEALGRVFLVGNDPGLAQTMKLVNNMMSVAALAITSEAMVLGTKAGLDPSTMIEVLNASTGRNSATVDKFPRAVLPGTFNFGFPIGLSMKDIGLCLDEAERMGLPMPIGSTVRQMMSIAQATYGPDADFTSICRVFEAWGGTEVRAAREASG